MTESSIQEHLQKIADAHSDITSGQLESTYLDFFHDTKGQEFSDEINWLEKFAFSGLAISNLRPTSYTDNILKWLSSPEFINLGNRQKMGIRDRFRWWRVKRALQTLFNFSNQSDEIYEVDEDDEIDVFELLSAQNSRYIAIFVLSGYTYTEAYGTTLLKQALEIEPIASYAWNTIKPLKNIFDKPPSKTDPEFTHFQELVNRKMRNVLEKLDLIVKGLGLNKQIEAIEHQLKMPSVRGSFVHLIRIRNDLAHEDPLKDLEDYSLSQLGEISTQIMQQWEKKLGTILEDVPELETPISWINDMLKNFMTTLPGIQLLGLMLIGYPSLVEKLIIPGLHR